MKIDFKNNKIIEALDNAIFPRNITCLICGHDIFDDNPYLMCENCQKKGLIVNGRVCKKCGASLFSNSSYCYRCQKENFYFDRAISVFYYEAEIIRNIKQFKFEGFSALKKSFAKSLAYCYIVNNLTADYILYVPLYISKEKKRGYNQSKLLAHELAKLINLPVLDDVLVKIVNNESQVGKTLKERQENVKNVYSVKDKEKIKGKRILIIDDVLSTGSTLNACAKVLKSCKCESVIALTYAQPRLKIDKYFEKCQLKGLKTFGKISKVLYTKF